MAQYGHVTDLLADFLFVNGQKTDDLIAQFGMGTKVMRQRGSLVVGPDNQCFSARIFLKPRYQFLSYGAPAKTSHADQPQRKDTIQDGHGPRKIEIVNVMAKDKYTNRGNHRTLDESQNIPKTGIIIKIAEMAMPKKDDSLDQNDQSQTLIAESEGPVFEMEIIPKGKRKPIGQGKEKQVAYKNNGRISIGQRQTASVCLKSSILFEGGSRYFSRHILFVYTDNI